MSAKNNYGWFTWKPYFILQAMENLKEGDKAPEFTLPSESGTEISLNDYKNKKIVLWFFPKANTPG